MRAIRDEEEMRRGELMRDNEGMGKEETDALPRH